MTVGHSKRLDRLKRSDIQLFLGAGIVCGLLFFSIKRDAGRPPADSGKRTAASFLRSAPKNGWYAFPPLASLPEFRISVEPEFLRALDAALPDNETCKKVRYKKVPVKKLQLNGLVLEGPHSLRYRGFCRGHWGWRQKSLKLQAPKEHRISGYRTVNLNAMTSDPFLFEAWTGLLLYRSGGVASRTGLARVYVNGEYDGLRQIGENIDQDLLREQGLSKGALYRERTHAGMGDQHSGNRDLKEKWKKNSLKKSDWRDLEQLNDSVFDSVHKRADSFKSFVNLRHYVNYSAVITITGTMHLNNHNIPLYRPRQDSKFIPVGYDFGENLQGAWVDRHPAVQVPYAAMNWLSQLFWADRVLRRDIHARTAELLAGFPDMVEWYDDILQAAEPQLARDIAAGLILDDPDARIGSLRSYRVRNSVRRRIRARTAFLRRAYLDPIARITPGWKSFPRSQMAIEGAGLYRLRFEAHDSPCREGASIKVRVHQGSWRDAVVCMGGKLETKDLIAERNDLNESARLCTESNTESFKSFVNLRHYVNY
ncbi:CotH kinase family protein, partial [Elusimicrobiota bacterium]